MDPKVDPKPDPLWGAQVLEKAMNSNGFGAFWSLRGIQFRTHFWIHFGFNFGTPGIGDFSKK